jgi:rubrerythrin
LFGDEPMNVDRSMLWDVEAPEFDEARAFMSIQEALEVALAAEVKAYEYFDHAFPELRDAGVKALFAELRVVEIEHQDLVKQEMAKAGKAAGFDPTDFEDEPTAQ